MAAKKSGKRKAKKKLKAKAKAKRKASALRKASIKKGRPRTMKAPTVLFNCRLDKPALGIAKQKAKKYFRGNMSALVRVALKDWKPVKHRAAIGQTVTKGRKAA